MRKLRVVATGGSCLAMAAAVAFPTGSAEGGNVRAEVNEPIYVYDVRDHRLRKPKTLYFGASGRIRSINWRTWDGPRARGRGKYPYNNCRPSCADGNVTRYRVRTVLSKVRYCGGPYRYVKLSWVFRNPPRGIDKRHSTNWRYL